MLLGRERRKVGKGEEGDVLASPCVYWQRVGDHPDAQLETGVPKLCRCRYGQPLIMKKKGAEWCVPYVHLCMCVRGYAWNVGKVEMLQGRRRDWQEHSVT